MEIVNNFAGSSGGGVLVGPSSVELHMHSCQFANNIATASGAQLTMRSGGALGFHDVHMNMFTSSVSQVGDLCHLMALLQPTSPNGAVRQWVHTAPPILFPSSPPRLLLPQHEILSMPAHHVRYRHAILHACPSQVECDQCGRVVRSGNTLFSCSLGSLFVDPYQRFGAAAENSIVPDWAPYCTLRTSRLQFSCEVRACSPTHYLALQCNGEGCAAGAP